MTYALPCVLFNIALEKDVRYLGINLRGTIFYKSVQILACAGDIDIIGWMQKAMKEAFTNLEKAAKKIHLQINQGEKIYASYQENLHR
jgi:sorting nexin-29